MRLERKALKAMSRIAGLQRRNGAFMPIVFKNIQWQVENK